MLGEIVRKLVLVMAALVALGFAEDRRLAGDQLFRTQFDYHWPTWASWVALLILTGLLVGLAALPGWPRVRGYRWWVPLVMGLPPALILGRFVMVFGVNRPIIDLPIGPWMNTTTQFALAIMLGSAFAAGFRFAPRAKPTSTEDTEGPGPQP